MSGQDGSVRSSAYYSIVRPNGPPCAKSSKKRWLAELELVAEANAVQQVVAWRAVRRRSRASRRDAVGRRRDVVRAEQRRVSVQPPVETGTRFSPETKGRILGLLDEQRRTKHQIRLDRQIRRRPSQLQIE